jgi:hypothetical protein
MIASWSRRKAAPTFYSSKDLVFVDLVRLMSHTLANLLMLSCIVEMKKCIELQILLLFMGGYATIALSNRLCVFVDGDS